MARSGADLTGQKFGRLTALSKTRAGGITRWLCRCDCGKETAARPDHLTAGKTQSCGCYRAQHSRESKLIDLSGQKFGRLAVVSLVPDRRPPHWLCLCDCGQKASVEASNLKGGHTTSCGCYAAERRGQSSITHGLSGSPTWVSWNKMIQRCTNPKEDNYQFYGGRGITFDPRWAVFENFLADMGVRPKGLTLDRKEVNGPYSPDNCRWATRAEQAANHRRNVFVTIDGRRMTVTEAMKVTGKSRYLLNRQSKLEAEATTEREG